MNMKTYTDGKTFICAELRSMQDGPVRVVGLHVSGAPELIGRLVKIRKGVGVLGCAARFRRESGQATVTFPYYVEASGFGRELPPEVVVGGRKFAIAPGL